MKPDLRPLDRVRSIRTKLGALVAVTVTVASVLAVVGTQQGVSPWVTVPVAVVVALVVTQVLARGMTSPLREMTVAAGRMSEGDYSLRVRATSRDEVGDLARAFNRMSATLESVDQHRRDLVANVSHELRTPISALRAVLENLVDGVASPGPEQLRAALTQTERLTRLVADLLDLSRLEEGVTSLRTEGLVVRDLLEDAVAQARTDGLRYAVDVHPADLTLPGDPDRLHQLLANLIDNANRHSPRDGEVRLSAERVGPEVRLVVADEGPGIPAADRVAVFERFTTSAAHHSGTGLGLAISRWVAQLHGGSISVRDSEIGAHILVTLPAEAGRPVPRKDPVVSTLTPPAPQPPSALVPVGSVVTDFWPDAPRRRPGLVAAAAVVGTVAAVVLPDRDLGLGWAAVLAAVTGTVVAGAVTRTGSVRWDRLRVVDVGLLALLCLTLVLRDAEWVTVLCLFAALGLTAIGSTRASGVVAMLASAVAVPVAAIRGLPWLRRVLTTGTPTHDWVRVARTAGLSVALLLVFGALFASADALFASWVDALTPDITLDDTPARVVLALFVAAGTLAATFVALAPPAVDRLRLPVGTIRGTAEWLVPVLVVDAVFVAFLAAQATALFGGHDYLQRTTGLTYADYVHQGFGQLTVATVLTLTVVAWAARRAPAGRERTLALGALCVMTVVVVLSALNRMRLYEDAYGLTRLRLLVAVFEAWLGIVVLLVIAAGVVGAVVRGHRWVVPAAVRLGAVGLLGLALANPDLLIAQHNLDRVDTATGTDWSYLGQLSDDAAPALTDLPAAQLACVLPFSDRVPGVDQPGSDWLSWNSGRSRADELWAGATTVAAGQDASAAPDPTACASTVQR